MTPEPARVPPDAKIPEPVARWLVTMNAITSELAALVRELKDHPPGGHSGKAA